MRIDVKTHHNLLWQTYRITMESGFTVTLLNHGATLLAVETPDRNGRMDNVIVGYEDLNTYGTNPLYMGATIGRTAGRVADARLPMAELVANHGRHQLHGGPEGLSHKVWDTFVEDVRGEDHVQVIMYTESKAGASGYPGNLSVRVIYTIYENHRLKIEYDAITDADTMVNLTNHAYFNLGGHRHGTIMDHDILVEADFILELDQELIPTGKELNVAGTPFDLRQIARLGTRIGNQLVSSHPQLLLAGGFDHPWVLNGTQSEGNGASIGGKVMLSYEGTGRRMDVHTTQPVAVIYSVNGACDVTMTGGKGLQKHGAICIECQKPPVGKDGLFAEQILLKKDDRYHEEILYEFSTISDSHL